MLSLSALICYILGRETGEGKQQVNDEFHRQQSQVLGFEKPMSNVVTQIKPVL